MFFYATFHYVDKLDFLWCISVCYVLYRVVFRDLAVGWGYWWCFERLENIRSL